MSSKVVLEEKLIDYVRKNEVLYNTDMKEYSDNNFKLKIWHQIAKCCGMASGEEAKRQWKNLRDGYRSALKMYKTGGKIGDSTKKMKTWKYFDQMNFLRPYMRDRRSNLGLDLGPDYSDDTQIFDDTSQENRHSGIIKEETLEFEPPGYIDDETEAYQDDGSPLSKKLCLSARSKNDQFGDRLQEIQWTQDTILPIEDGLKLFFDSMYASTKKLSPALQRVVKNKLFQAVNEAEIEMEASQQDKSSVE